ncbi:hypothetical protein HQQ88_10550 [Curtobacterium sp. VKM Ac-2861]|uniref:hypothetical protein n=1 Tax=Curtobacterium sp. VKM Ac-2861 TaxID=2739016 RepID=UPI00156592DD|nr:hypothetical protein [Curtobacterium sp. VKM Ac-2861]
MPARLRRHTAALVLVGVAVVAAVVCAVAARGAGPMNPVSWWIRGTDEHVVATKSQFDSWLLALHVAEVAAVVAVVAVLAAVVTAVVSSRRRRTRV